VNISEKNVSNFPEAISCGTAHTCAVLSDGSVKCWGSNSHGQLGTGNMIQMLYPTYTVIGLNNGMVCVSVSVVLELYQTIPFLQLFSSMLERPTRVQSQRMGASCVGEQTNLAK
jgi:hypothetical protein